MALLWTDASDVKDRWLGGEMEATDAQIERLLADAEDTVLREFPDIADRIGDPPDKTLPLLRVQKVVARMVIRHLRNPEGVRTVQETGGPYSETRTVGGNDPGAMYLTDDERAELSEARTGKAFTIDQTPASWSEPAGPDLWLTIGQTYL